MRIDGLRVNGSLNEFSDDLRAAQRACTGQKRRRENELVRSLSSFTLGSFLSLFLTASFLSFHSPFCSHMSTHSFLPTPFRMPCCASFSPPLLRPSFLLVSLLSFLPSFFLSFFSFSTFNPPVVFSLLPLLHPFFLLFFSPAHSFDHFGFKTHFFIIS